ncbi:MAG: class I SAM-dependent methyltransferase [Rhodobacteraceae bacterium]|nr:class I SAM-dependent methyltransferase [Paracoccaceae bacterium]
MNIDEIASLDTSAFSNQDILNLILQRSEIIRDQDNYNSYIKAWTRGNSAPIMEIIEKLGTDLLAKRAGAVIYLEYLELKPIFENAPPRKVADIGCGYAFFDLFLARDFGCGVVLIDLEQNSHRHFGFETEGAAYSNLDVARKFLIDNGLTDGSIFTLNPETDDLDKVTDVDFAFSFISCGFHYPWQTYQHFFETSLNKGGAVILDIRRRKSAAAQAEMTALGTVDVIGASANGSANRVMLTL